MALGDPEIQCGCGRFGCWETAVGLQALIHASPAAAADTDSPVLGIDARLNDLLVRAQSKDAETTARLDAMARWLGIGASVLANMLAPEVIILGGHFAALREFLDTRARIEFRTRLIAGPDTTRLEYSALGFEAPALGGGHAGIDLILQDPSLVGTHLLVESST